MINNFFWSREIPYFHNPYIFLRKLDSIYVENLDPTIRGNWLFCCINLVVFSPEKNKSMYNHLSLLALIWKCMFVHYCTFHGAPLIIVICNKCMAISQYGMAISCSHLGLAITNKLTQLSYSSMLPTWVVLLDLSFTYLLVIRKNSEEVCCLLQNEKTTCQINVWKLY